MSSSSPYYKYGSDVWAGDPLYDGIATETLERVVMRSINIWFSFSADEEAFLSASQPIALEAKSNSNKGASPVFTGVTKNDDMMSYEVNVWKGTSSSPATIADFLDNVKKRKHSMISSKSLSTSTSSVASSAATTVTGSQYHRIKYLDGISGNVQ